MATMNRPIDWHAPYTDAEIADAMLMYANRCRVAVSVAVATGNPAETLYAYLNARWAARLGLALLNEGV